MQENLLPDGAPIGIFKEVDLVQHHPSQVSHSMALCIEHVAEHLGSHHYHWRLGSHYLVAGHQADPVMPEHLSQIPVLLVGKSLDRCGVEDASSCS